MLRYRICVLACLQLALLCSLNAIAANKLPAAMEQSLKQIEQQLDGKGAPPLSKDELQRVAKKLSEILAADPTSSKALYLRGVTKVNLGDTPKAMVDFDAALKMQPKHGKAHWWRGIGNCEIGNPQAAVNDFTSALQLGEKSPMVYMNLGTAYQQLRRHQEAVSNFDTAIKLNPGLWQARFMRANSQVELREYHKCMQDCDALIASPAVPADVKTLSRKTRAGCLLHLNRNREAIAELTKAAEGLTGKAKGSVIYMRGAAHEKLGEVGLANVDLQTARELGIAVKQAPRDQVTHTEGAATIKMENAIQALVKSARAKLPEVKTRYLKGLPKDQLLYVTTKLYSDAARFEQVFVKVNSWKGDSISGTLESAVKLPNHKQGEPLNIKEADVLDWTITKPDGSEEGNVVGKFLDTWKP